ncbi:MAG: shikimate kinase [Clostridia bacterium]|nr:shikimate kinase [Clostridia bacterium]
MKNGYKKMRCGLLGEKLGHSFSPIIHAELCDYSYELIELAPNELEKFVRSDKLDAYNVTIPYKKDIIPFLDTISPEAMSIGAVNTVVKYNNKLCGYNTDYFGFCHILDKSGICVTDKKALVLGTGGASATVCAVLNDRKTREIVTVSIEDNTPEFLKKHNDAQIIINATPVGMYPKNGYAPVSLSLFPKCEGVVDVVYNPSKTQLLLDAESLNIPYINGLPMLVAQAAKAFEFFTGESTDDGECERITSIIENKTKNIILIGMPGCGKTTVGKILSEKLGRPFYDADEIFAKTYEVSPAEVITNQGEPTFRDMEHKIINELGKLSGGIIACGGGVITREENYNSLHQNGTIIFIERALEKLSTNNRPLSLAGPLEALYNSRINAYNRFADIKVISTEVPQNTAKLILKELNI